MAKGDHAQAMSNIKRQQATQSQARSDMSGLMMPMFQNSYNTGLRTRDSALGSYGDAANYFKNLRSNVDPTMRQNFLDALNGMDYNFDIGRMRGGGGYEEFAKTGGFSDADKLNFRSRVMSPLTSTYANAADEIARTRSLQGGYSPNAIAAQAQMARNLGEQARQGSMETEASLADEIRKGKEFGLQGMTSSEQAVANAMAQKAQMNYMKAGLSEDWAKFLADLDIASGQGLTSVGNAYTNLLGTSDANSGMFLNALLSNLGSQGGEQTNLINSMIQASMIPSDFSQALGNIGGVFDVVGKAGGALTGLGGVSNMFGGGSGLTGINGAPKINFGNSNLFNPANYNAGGWAGTANFNPYANFNFGGQ